MSHSPTPWNIRPYRNGSCIYAANNIRVCVEEGDAIMDTQKETVEGNRRLIIEAVNKQEQHDALVAENAALKQRIKEIDKRLEFIENNDVYWNMDDPDETGNSPEEIACNNSLDKEAYMKFGGKKYVEGFIAFTATEIDDEGNPCDWEPVCYENEEDAASSWRLSVAALQESQP